MILFPTRGRAWALSRFIRAYKATHASIPVVVIVDEDNLLHYERVWNNEAPEGWTLFPNKDSRDLVAACNNVFGTYPDEPFYALIADDVVPHTDDWDTTLATEARPHFVAWGNDGIHTEGQFAATHPFIGGDLVRAWGWFMPPYTKRGSADLIWRDFAVELGLARFRKDILLEHMHFHVGKGEFDITYASQPSHTSDGEAYRVYKASPMWSEDLKRVRTFLNL